MTNREWLEQKKEVFCDKLGDWLVKHFNIICLLCVVLDAILLVCVLLLKDNFALMTEI